VRALIAGCTVAAVFAIWAVPAVAEDGERVAKYVDPNSGVTVEGKLDVSARQLVLRLTMPSGIRLNARYGIWIKPLPGTGVDWSGELPYTHMEDRDYFDDPLRIELSYRPRRGQQSKVALQVEYGWCDLSEGICVPAETVLRF